jgi:lipoate-protein ligase A
MTATNDHQGDGSAMRLLELTLPTPAENLALDEALLDEAEASETPCEVLRLWEPAAPLVVVGRSSKLDEEVDRAACARLGIPVLRRASGGAAIVAGPGCLMYAVVLNLETRPELCAIGAAHEFVLGRLADALADVVSGAERRGTSDLALADRKFSGNSLRVKRRHMLYHGTLLYDFPLDLIEECLLTPPRQPGYRQRRTHGDFVQNISAAREELRAAVVSAFTAIETKSDWPVALTMQLTTEKYATQEWTLSR